MVTITAYKHREAKDGRTFFALSLQGDLRIETSESGNFYLTANRISVTTSFNEAICKSLIGKVLSGTIKKVPCPEYEYTNKETGEIISMNYKYEYSLKETNIKTENLNHFEVQQQTQNPFVLKSSSEYSMAS